MASLALVLATTYSIFFTPFLMSILCIIFLASIGKSLGVRKLYVKLLLVIFEYGKANIEESKRKRNDDDVQNDDEEEEMVSTTKDSESLVTNKVEDDGGGGSQTLINRKNITQLSDCNNSDSISKTTPSKKKNGIVNGTSHVISRDNLILVPDPVQNYAGEKSNSESTDINNSINNSEENQKPNILYSLDLLKAGVEAIIEDQVTSRFQAEELKNWNLLTRTNRNYEFISWKLTVMWACGFVVRHFFLFPLRFIICWVGVSWMVLGSLVISPLPTGSVKRWLNDRLFMSSFRIFMRSLSAVLRFHNKEYEPKRGGLCVANHTTVIDVVVLSTSTSFSLIGQRHGGFLGLLQRALARASPHIWFERSEVKDRAAVTRRLREHISNPKNPPILIFPEGTCINNTSVMQFKKGSFEVGGVIYPVAIKYDPRFGDAFWNSSKYSMLQYLYMMMTSWAIVCDVWYLPPMYQQPDESAIDFANRVKSVIATQGGLVDLMWDGQLKRMRPKKELMELQQQEFSRRFKNMDKNL